MYYNYQKNNINYIIYWLWDTWGIPRKGVYAPLR
jgi:hypothetical protein